MASGEQSARFSGPSRCGRARRRCAEQAGHVGRVGEAAERTLIGGNSRVSLGRCLRRTKVVGEGRQISRLRCGQVGERRGGLAWGGSVSERRPGENGDSDVEGVVARRPPVAVAGVEGSGLSRPVGQHVGKKRLDDPCRVPGRVGYPGQAGGGAGDVAFRSL